MRYSVYSYRHGEELLRTVPEYVSYWDELAGVIESVTDARIAEVFQAKYEGKKKSISHALNEIFDNDLQASGWNPQSPIFGASEYGDSTWRLDFAKGPISVEVAFNHGGNIAWNLVKPVIASEINHVQKAVQTDVGVVIAASNAMKVMGGFDSAVGSAENYVSHLLPLRNMLTVPLVIVALEPCETFCIRHEKVGRNKIGWIDWNQPNEPSLFG